MKDSIDDVSMPISGSVMSSDCSIVGNLGLWSPDLESRLGTWHLKSGLGVWSLALESGVRTWECRLKV